MGILRTAAEGGAEVGMKGTHASFHSPPLYSKMATVDYESSVDPEMDLTSDEELERYPKTAVTLIRGRPTRPCSSWVLGKLRLGIQMYRDPELVIAA